MKQEREIAIIETLIENCVAEPTEENLKACANVIIFQKQLWKTIQPQLESISSSFVAEALILAKKMVTEYQKARTEMGIAENFAKEKNLDVKFCSAFQNSWAVWGQEGWQEDQDNMVMNWIKEHIKHVADGEAKLEKASVVSAVAKLLQYERSIVTKSEQWDASQDLLGTPGGVVDLKTGDVKRNNRGLLISKKTSVAPSATEDCPRWLKFLNEATGCDQEYIDYLQKVAGYCLTGSIREHALFFAYGDGGNGKSVFIETIGGVMGNYWDTAQMDTFVAKQFENHTTELAGLRGARLVTAVETEEGRRWAEAKIKQLTGGDTITARFMRQDNFKFKPEFKLLIAGNHAPSLNSVDRAIKRRFHILPFDNKPNEVDKHLDAKLREEWSGILKWMINGAVKWYVEGLEQPRAVSNATVEYFEDQNIFEEWFSLNFEESKNDWDTVEVSQVYGSMKIYYESYGMKAMNRTAFGKKMKTKGVESGKSNGARVYKYLNRISEEDQD